MKRVMTPKPRSPRSRTTQSGPRGAGSRQLTKDFAKWSLAFVEVNFVRRVTEDGDFPAVLVGRPADGERIYYELQPLFEQFGKEQALERMVPIHIQLKSWIEVSVILPVLESALSGPSRRGASTPSSSMCSLPAVTLRVTP